MKSRAMYLYDHFNPILLIAVCFMVFYLYSQGLFSQVKIIDGIDSDGKAYVEKLIGNIYPADKAEFDNLMNSITKQTALNKSRNLYISEQTDDAGGRSIYMEVSCQDKTTTQDFINFLKTINAKMVLKWHRCKNSDLTGENNVPCVEKPIDVYSK